jgi:hypothetical protein
MHDRGYGVARAEAPEQLMRFIGLAISNLATGSPAESILPEKMRRIVAIVERNFYREWLLKVTKQKGDFNRESWFHVTWWLLPI